MFHPIVFHLYVSPDQKNTSAPWLIPNTPTEAPRVGSLQPGRGHSTEMQGCGPGEGFTDAIAIHTPNNPAAVPQGPTVLSAGNKNIRAALMIFPQRQGVYNPTLPFWQISAEVTQYKITWPEQETYFDQDRPGILGFSQQSLRNGIFYQI